VGWSKHEVHYPLKPAYVSFAHEETVRLEARGAAEWVPNPEQVDQLAHVQPWVVPLWLKNPNGELA